MGGDQQYRGFRRVVEVLKSGLKVRDEKSNIIQYAGCNTPMKTDNNPNIKPHPSINNKGVVTWDYGNISNYTDYSQLNRLPGDALPTMDKTGYLDFGVGMNDNPGQFMPAFIDTYLYNKHKDVLLDYYKTVNTSKYVYEGGSEDGTTTIRIDRPYQSSYSVNETRRTDFWLDKKSFISRDDQFNNLETRCFTTIINKFERPDSLNVALYTSRVLTFVGAKQSLSSKHNDLAPNNLGSDYLFSTSTHGDTNQERLIYSPYISMTPAVNYRYYFAVLPPLNGKNDYVIIVYRHVRGETFTHNSNHKFTCGFIVDILRIPKQQVDVALSGSDLTRLSNYHEGGDTVVKSQFHNLLKAAREIVKIPKYSGMKFQLSPLYLKRTR